MQGPQSKLLRRVGILGDIHAEDKALEAALSFLRGTDSLDTLLCTGDIVTGPGDAGRCCTLLTEAGVQVVRGNHDRWFFASGYDQMPLATPREEIDVSARAFLATLPPTRDFETPQGPMLLCHGLGSDDMAGVHPHDYGYALDANHRLHALVGQGKYHYVVNGHTHRCMVRTFDGLTIINAGTLRRDHQPGFLVVDFAARRVQSYNVKDGLDIEKAETYDVPA